MCEVISVCLRVVRVRESDDPLLFVLGLYAYTSHLLEFQRRRPGVEERVLSALEEWSRVVCPMPCRVWEWYLRGHPDDTYRDYIIQGLQRGFRVGFQYGRCHCTGASANMQSVVRQPEVIDEYLAREVRVMGPLEPCRYPEVHINKFGLVPIAKNHQPGKWHLVVDLSHPRGASVNDGLEPELCSIRYTSVDVAVRRVLALGQGSLLAKFDVEGLTEQFRFIRRIGGY